MSLVFSKSFLNIVVSLPVSKTLAWSASSPLSPRANVTGLRSLCETLSISSILKLRFFFSIWGFSSSGSKLTPRAEAMIPHAGFEGAFSRLGGLLAINFYSSSRLSGANVKPRLNAGCEVAFTRLGGLLAFIILSSPRLSRAKFTVLVILGLRRIEVKADGSNCSPLNVRPIVLNICLRLLRVPFRVPIVFPWLRCLARMSFYMRRSASLSFHSSAISC